VTWDLGVVHLELGNVAEWATAAFTFLFFGATWLTIKRDHDEKRKQAEEERLDEAQKVTVGVAATAGPPSSVDGSLTSLIGVNVANAGR
jgi:hypothetical protein